MKTIIALVLAVIVGGCAGQWRVISPKCATGQTAWANTERCGPRGERRMIFVDNHPEERPDRCLYVIDSTSAFYSPNGFVLTLRPARPTDMGRHYAWHEIPDVFSPCPEGVK